MSALAARRAAAAALSATSSPQLEALPSASSSTPSKRTINNAKTSLPRDLTPESVSSKGTSRESSEPKSTAPKRRKIEITRQSPPPAKSRYFQEPTTTHTGKGKERAFSPSLPVNFDEEGDDSSDGQSAIESGDEDVEDEMENGTVRWDLGISAPPTPRPGYHAPVSNGKRDTATSNFDPKQGVNMVRVTAETLVKAGIDGKGDGIVISLSLGENLMIAGVYTITPLQQTLSIFSTRLNPGKTSYPVFAPTSHPIPVIQRTEHFKTVKSPFLTLLYLPPSFALHDGKVPRTVFLIRENGSGIDGMRHEAIPNFSNIWTSEIGPWGLCNVHPVVGSFPVPVYPYIVPPSWSSALNLLESKNSNGEDADVPVVLVKGPKRVGKSTLARSALNTLLEGYERVAWLESDLGQGEFGCGGMVGLWIVDRPVLGPPFTHPATPHRACYLGTYTPVTCPDEYVQAIQHLVEVYKYEIQYPSSSSSSSGKRSDMVPLVVNTQGWIKGLGEDLLRLIELASMPTHVFAFDNLLQEHNDDEGMTHSPGYNPIPLPLEGDTTLAKTVLVQPAPISALHTRYTGADMRILSMISYLHSDSGPKWDFDQPIPAMRPLELEIGTHGPVKDVYLIGEGSDGIVSEDLALALNGSVVALGQNLNPSSTLYTPSRHLPSNDDLNVLGLGLIRAVEAQEEGYKIHLITPLSSTELSRINCLIKNGSVELPLCGLLDWRASLPGDKDKGERLFGVGIGDVPFLRRGGEGVGVERRRVRRNLQRRNV